MKIFTKKFTQFLQQSSLVVLVKFFYIWPNEVFDPININVLKLVRFKTFLTVNMKIWLWHSGQLPPSSTLPYRLHNDTYQQTAAACQTVQIFTSLQNAFTKEWTVNSWYIATWLHSCCLVHYVSLVKLQTFSEYLLRVNLCNL